MKITETHTSAGSYLNIEGNLCGEFKTCIRMESGETPDQTLLRYIETERTIREESHKRHMRAATALRFLERS